MFQHLLLAWRGNLRNRVMLTVTVDAVHVALMLLVGFVEELAAFFALVGASLWAHVRSVADAVTGVTELHFWFMGLQSILGHVEQDIGWDVCSS